MTKQKHIGDRYVVEDQDSLDKVLDLNEKVIVKLIDNNFTITGEDLKRLDINCKGEVTIKIKDCGLYQLSINKADKVYLENSKITGPYADEITPFVSVNFTEEPVALTDCKTVNIQDVKIINSSNRQSHLSAVEIINTMDKNIEINLKNLYIDNFETGVNTDKCKLLVKNSDISNANCVMHLTKSSLKIDNIKFSNIDHIIRKDTESEIQKIINSPQITINKL